MTWCYFISLHVSASAESVSYFWVLVSTTVVDGSDGLAGAGSQTHKLGISIFCQTVPSNLPPRPHQPAQQWWKLAARFTDMPIDNISTQNWQPYLLCCNSKLCPDQCTLSDCSADYQKQMRAANFSSRCDQPLWHCAGPGPDILESWRRWTGDWRRRKSKVKTMVGLVTVVQPPLSL